ncbi:MAG TPA: AsmA family protein, partial [Thermodesulfovibrionales bacterium]|nr:AsmA family protein [Thermodesulfovibrionales bacterium]
MKESMKRKNLLLWLTGSIGVIVLIIVALSFLVPKLIDLESIREKIKADISQKISGEVGFEKMEVSFFPRPLIVISNATFSFPGTAEGTIASLRMFLRLRPLFSGEVRIAGVQLVSPRVSITVSEREREREKTASLSAREVEEKVSALLKSLATTLPETRIVVEQGSVKISDARSSLVLFEDIAGQLTFSPGEASVALTCSSDISRSISIGIRLDPRNLKGIGTVKFTGLKPQHIIHHLFPDTVKFLGDSEGNFILSLRMLGSGEMEAEVQGSIPHLTLLNRGERVLVRGIDMSGAFAAIGERTEITLNELKVEYPRLTLSCELIRDKTARTVSLELSGKGVDVPSLRTVALSLAGGVPLVRDIFGYVRGGRLSFITVRSHGASLEDLGSTESISITGVIERGEIFVPGPKLDFKEVNGDCIISQGILEGKKVEGILGKSEVRDGKLRVGLRGSDAPLHIDAAVKADLAEASNILRRLVKDESFVKEIDLVRSVSGEARGRVILGESTAVIKPRIDLSEVSFAAEYERLPFPVLIKGGQFSYDETRVGARKLAGALGKSSFADLTGELRFGNDPHLEATSGTVKIDPDEVYPWLASFEGLKSSLKEVRSVRGLIKLDTLAVRGP